MKIKLFILLSILILMLFNYKYIIVKPDNIIINKIDEHTIMITEINKNIKDNKQSFYSILKELNKIDTSSLTKIKYTKVVEKNYITFPNIIHDLCKNNFMYKDIEKVARYKYNKFIKMLEHKLNKQCNISLDYYLGAGDNILHYKDQMLIDSNISISNCTSSIPIINYIVFNCK